VADDVYYRLRVVAVGLQNLSAYNTFSLFHLHICQVCGSFQCPYCDYYNAAPPGVMTSHSWMLSLLCSVFIFWLVNNIMTRNTIRRPSHWCTDGDPCCLLLNNCVYIKLCCGYVYPQFLNTTTWLIGWDVANHWLQLCTLALLCESYSALCKYICILCDVAVV